MTEYTASVLVPVGVGNRVAKTLERLSKRAGVPFEVQPGVTTLVIPDQHREGKTVAVECTRISVGDLPRQSGWTIVARIEHTEAGNVVNIAPGESLHAMWREAAPRCDHCSAERRRNDTFVLRGPNGEFKQIGRNCLADFCSAEAAAMVARAEWCATLWDFFPENPENDGWGSSWYGAAMTTTAEFLAAACKAVRVAGFRKSAEMSATKHDAWFAVNPPPRDDRARKAWVAAQPEEQDLAEANDIMLWVATDEEFAQSDYGHNIRTALACRGVNTKRDGLVASAPAAYHRMIGRAIEKRDSAAAVDGGHWGEVGKRETVEATLTGISFIESNFGPGAIAVLRFRTTAGQDLVWFSSGAKRNHPGSDDVGGIFNVKATVKRHDQRKGRAQTIISRAKVTKPIAKESP